VKATYEGDDENLGTSEMVNFAVEQYAERSIFSVSSNSTVSGFAFDSERQELSFVVTGESGTTGYADVYIAKSLISDIANVKAYLDCGEKEYTVTSVGDSWLLHFSYQHSTHKVSISLGLPPPASLLENPFSLALVIGGILTLPVALAVMFMRKRITKRRNQLV